MFSKTCEYAIRALIFLARESADEQKIGIREIATGIDAPQHFIAKILQDLSRKGLVQSLKGPNGGFFLNEASLHGSLADIVEAVDGNKLFFGCGLGLKECSETRPCPLHDEFKKLRDDIHAMLVKTKLHDFAAEAEVNLSFLKR